MAWLPVLLQCMQQQAWEAFQLCTPWHAWAYICWLCQAPSLRPPLGVHPQPTPSHPSLAGCSDQTAAATAGLVQASLVPALNFDVRPCPGDPRCPRMCPRHTLTPLPSGSGPRLCPPWSRQHLHGCLVGQARTSWHFAALLGLNPNPPAPWAAAA